MWIRRLTTAIVVSASLVLFISFPAKRRAPAPTPESNPVTLRASDAGLSTVAQTGVIGSGPISPSHHLDPAQEVVDHPNTLQIRKDFYAYLSQQCPQLRTALLCTDGTMSKASWDSLMFRLAHLSIASSQWGEIESAIERFLSTKERVECLVVALSPSIVMRVGSLRGEFLRLLSGDEGLLCDVLARPDRVPADPPLRESLMAMARCGVHSWKEETRLAALRYIIAMSVTDRVSSLCDLVRNDAELRAIVPVIKDWQRVDPQVAEWLERFLRDSIRHGADVETFIEGISVLAKWAPDNGKRLLGEALRSGQLGMIDAAQLSRAISAIPLAATQESAAWLSEGMHSAQGTSQATVWLQARLGLRGVPVSEEELKRYLSDPRPEVRSSAVEACSSREQLQAVSSSDPSEDVRVAGLWRLSELGANGEASRLGKDLLFTNPRIELREGLMALLQNVQNANEFGVTLGEYRDRYADENGQALAEFWMRYRLKK